MAGTEHGRVLYQDSDEHFKKQKRSNAGAMALLIIMAFITLSFGIILLAPMMIVIGSMVVFLIYIMIKDLSGSRPFTITEKGIVFPNPRAKFLRFDDIEKVEIKSWMKSHYVIIMTRSGRSMMLTPRSTKHTMAVVEDILRVGRLIKERARRSYGQGVKFSDDVLELLAHTGIWQIRTKTLLMEQARSGGRTTIDRDLVQRWLKQWDPKTKRFRNRIARKLKGHI